MRWWRGAKPFPSTPVPVELLGPVVKLSTLPVPELGHDVAEHGPFWLHRPSVKMRRSLYCRLPGGRLKKRRLMLNTWYSQTAWLMIPVGLGCPRGV